MKTETQKQNEGIIKQNIFRYLKALFVSLIITFACIILFAFIIKWASLPDKVLSPVNMAIKAISVFFGAMVLTRNSTKGMLQGLLFAGIYTILAFTIFSILAQKLTLGLGLIADLAFAVVVGAIGGAVGVNVKKNK